MAIVGIPIVSIILICETCNINMKPEPTEQGISTNDTYTIFICPQCHYKVKVYTTSLLRIEI